MTGTLRAAMLAHAGQERTALLTPEGTWTWPEYVGEAARRCHALDGLLTDDRPRHVGVLAENSAEFACQLAAAGLGGHVLVGLNTTRRGAGLLSDVANADCQVVLVDATHAPLLEGVALPGVTVLRTDGAAWRDRLAAAPTSVPAYAPEADDLFMLIFTSGTSGDPKAVRFPHGKVTGSAGYVSDRLGLTGDDVVYTAMPLFHSNAVVAGWGPVLHTGAGWAVAPRFSASRFLDDVRRYGATYTHYVGRPLSYVLATPERPDDAANPLRLAFGNEARDAETQAFAERFGCQVIDGFGSSENGVVVSRTPDTPPGALGQPQEGVRVLDPDTAEEKPRAVLDEAGRVLNPEEATGELVNTSGPGGFAGYYNAPEATAARMRGGMYWSGDLAYRDEQGFVYFAGRTADWLRVDGENIAAGPVEAVLRRHPALAEAAVYAVPDDVGDLLAVAVTLVEEPAEPFTPDALTAFLRAQEDLSPKAWPRLVRILDELPRTATHKVATRALRDVPGGHSWTREARSEEFLPVR